MTRRLRWIAFWEWLVNCPLLPRPQRRAPIQYEPLPQCQFFGSAYGKVDPVPLMRQPVWVERLKETI